jgi:hypothetical protein
VSVAVVLSAVVAYCAAGGIACRLLEEDGWDGGQRKPPAGLGAALWPIIVAGYLAYWVGALPYRATSKYIESRNRHALPEARRGDVLRRRAG